MRSSLIAAAVLTACTPPLHAPQPREHGAATPPVIDRFSKQAGHLMVRSADSPLPAAGEPIHFDRAPFQTQGLGPDGASVRYDNFDIQPRIPAPRYRLTPPGAHGPLPGAIPDLVDLLPGDAGYNDFWQLVLVEVPAGVEPTALTSVADLLARHYPTHATDKLLDCPIVPPGSTAPGGDGVAPPVTTTLTYRGARVSCLEFGTPLLADGGKVPTSPIYVTFKQNPPEGGPPSGFRTETPATPQTHNVVFSVPGDADYSPLWDVHIYDRAAFDSVHDANSASAAKLLVEHGPLVNCPIVSIGGKPPS